jgi:mannosyltransferase
MRLPNAVASFPRGRRSFGFAVALETALAAVTCLLYLGRKSFWLDESYSFVAAHRPFTGLLRVLVHDESNMATYYLALHGWLHAGRSEAAIRLLSVAPAVAAVPVVALLARRLAGTRVALIAGLLSALDLMVVEYAQEARAYAWLLLLVSISVWLFVIWVQTTDRRAAAGWVAVTVVATYTQYFAVLVVVALVASLWSLPTGQRPRRLHLAVSLTAIVVAVAPLAVFAESRGTSPLASASPASVLDPARLLYRFSGSVPLALVAIVLLIAAAATTWRTWSAGRSPQSWSHALLWSWLLLPPALTLGASLVHPAWKERYLIVSLPAFLILVSQGLADVRPSRLRVPALVATAALMVVALVGYYPTSVKQGTDWRAATLYAEQHALPGDAFRFVPENALVPFDYYTWSRSAPAPLDVGLAPRAFHDRIHPSALPESVIRQRIRLYHRVWVVLLQPTTSTAAAALRRQTRLVAAELGPAYHLVLSRRFGPLLVVRCFAR